MALKPFALILCLHVAVHRVANSTVSRYLVYRTTCYILQTYSMWLLMYFKSASMKKLVDIFR
jgi:hypothetical protein